LSVSSRKSVLSNGGIPHLLESVSLSTVTLYLSIQWELDSFFA
jgi:hypothetical protein